MKNFFIIIMFIGALLGGLATGLASAATGAIGSGISAGISKAQSKRDLENQKALNEHAFEKNKQLAELQNQYNIEQWERENAYNTPLEQAKRLKAAGLNPDLVAQGLGGLSAKSPSLVAGSPYNSPNVAEISNAAVNRGNSIVNAYNQTSQTQSNVASQDAATAYFNSVKEIRKQLEQGQLDTQGVQLDLMNFDLKELKPNEKSKLVRECQLLEKQSAHFAQVTEESRAKVALLNAQEQAQILDNMFNEATLDDRISKIGMEYAKLVFDTQISQTQAQHIGAYMLAQIWNLNSQSALNSTKNAIAKVEKEIAEKTKDNKISFENGKLEFNIEYNKVRKDNAQLLFYIETGIEVVDGVTSAANLWKSLLGKPKQGPKHRTTRTEKSDGTWSQTDTYDN